MRVRSVVVCFLLVACRSQVHVLEIADSCTCAPSEFCEVREAGFQCKALPASCGAKPNCSCIGEPSDSCRDEDGRLTLLPQRAVENCDRCAPEEYCLASGGPVCGVLPPACEEKDKRTCECFTHSRGGLGKISCREANGRVELTRTQ